MLTSLSKRKQIIVCFMAFSCKTGSIDRCLEQNVSAPTLGSLAGLLVCLSVQLNEISPRMYLAFIFLSIMLPLSIMFVSVDVSSTVDSLEAFEIGQVRRRRLGRNERVQPSDAQA